MTRRAMLEQVRANLLLDESSPLWGWAGPAEEYVLDTAADDTAQATDCYYAEQYDDLTAGKREYCFPKIYKPKALYMFNATGDQCPVTRTTVKALDRLYGKCWREWTSGQHTPRAAFAGLNTFYLTPPSATTITGGIMMAGFALSTLPAAGHERHQWDTADDECPFPAMAHNAVVLKATAIRAMQLAAKVPAMMAIADRYEAMWRTACGEVEMQATKLYQTPTTQGTASNVYNNY